MYNIATICSVLGFIADGIVFDGFNGVRNLEEGTVCMAIGLVKITCQCSRYCSGHRYLFRNIQYTKTTIL